MFENYIPSEGEEQAAVFEWANVMCLREPRLELLYHIPNGGLRNKATAARMKAEGVKAGVPDLCLPCPAGDHHGLYIEMKKRDHSNGPTKEQRNWIEWLRAQGYRVVVCYGADEAIGILEEYLGMRNSEFGIRNYLFLKSI